MRWLVASSRGGPLFPYAERGMAGPNAGPPLRLPRAGPTAGVNASGQGGWFLSARPRSASHWRSRSGFRLHWLHGCSGSSVPCTDILG